MRELIVDLMFALVVAIGVLTIWFTDITRKRLDLHAKRLRLLELKTGWLQVTEENGNRVTVEGTLDGLCIRQQKDEEPPYAS